MFFGPFLAHNKSNVVLQSFFAPFWHFSFLTQTDHIAEAIAFASCPILAIFKMLLFFEYKVFSGAVFCTQQLYCGRTMVFRTFLVFLIFDPNRPFSKGYGLCFLVNCGHFQNALISRFLRVFFLVVFCTKQL